MLEQVSAGGALRVVATGAAFVPLAVGLGFLLASRGLAVRGTHGRIRWRDAGLMTLAFAALVAAHALVLVWLGWYHPAVNTFYVLSGVLMSQVARARLAARGAPPPP
jgi:hypothetical protein